MTESHLLWFHRILRWGLGLIFICIGIVYYHEDAWPALLLGIVLLITGFLRPKRCIDDRCSLDN